MKRPLTALEMDESFMEAVHEGHKLVTIREGHRDYKNGDRLMILCAQDSFLPLRAVVTGVIHTTLGSVDESDRRSDMFDTVDDLLAGMRQFYPSIEKTSPVTVIRWRAE